MPDGTAFGEREGHGAAARGGQGSFDCAQGRLFDFAQDRFLKTCPDTKTTAAASIFSMDNNLPGQK
jgi:hypothetical protein